MQMTDQAKGSLGDFSSINALYTARQNIRITLEQVEHYNAIPDNVEGLKGVLTSDLHKMKIVYFELVKLENWRDKVMNIVKGQMESIRQEDYKQKDSAAMAHQKKRLDEQMKVINTMSDRFACVNEFHAFFKAQMWHVLFCSVDYAYRDPSVLVRVLEIIEIRDASSKRALEKAMERAEEEGGDPDDVHDAWVLSNWRGEAINELEKGIANRAQLQLRALKHMRAAEDMIHSPHNTEGNRHIDEDEEEEEDENAYVEPAYEVVPSLECGQLLIMELGFVSEAVVPCFPPIYDVFNRYYNTYLPAIYNAWNIMFTDPGLGQEDTLIIIKRIQYFEELLKKMGAPPAVSLNDQAKKLLNRFYDGVGYQMKNWLSNLLALVEEDENFNLLNNESGAVITTNPSDALNLVNQQVNYGKENLKGQDLTDLIIICVSTLKTFQDEQSRRLKVSWQIMRLDLICATLNDNVKFQELFGDFHNTMKDNQILDDIEADNLEQQLSIYVQGFLDVAQDALDAIVNSIFKDLKPLFSYYESGLFSKMWEENLATESENAAINSIIVTIADFLNDLKVFH
jgi:hypothetical protein